MLLVVAVGVVGFVVHGRKKRDQGVPVGSEEVSWYKRVGIAVMTVMWVMMIMVIMLLMMIMMVVVIVIMINDNSSNNDDIDRGGDDG